ncbi:hypothetical protein KUTeg_017298 [Tegillarca granosa]|uniref:Galectin n=1 Tax=Tegillarca granosa TaxID=220873 RepID=A0ABQ9EIR3_TEGGR|nr:hypothetical protein KUTeg_017298 [Tegillarca granosa]
MAVNYTNLESVPGTLQLNVPRNLISSAQYHVTLRGIGGLQFSNGVDIEYEEKHISIFIQTDKAVYKAVHFRIFALHRNGTVSLNKMDIKIYKENLMAILSKCEKRNFDWLLSL